MSSLLGSTLMNQSEIVEYGKPIPSVVEPSEDLIENFRGSRRGGGRRGGGRGGGGRRGGGRRGRGRRGGGRRGGGRRGGRGGCRGRCRGRGRRGRDYYYGDGGYDPYYYPYYFYNYPFSGYTSYPYDYSYDYPLLTDTGDNNDFLSYQLGYLQGKQEADDDDKQESFRATSVSGGNVTAGILLIIFLIGMFYFFGRRT